MVCETIIWTSQQLKAINDNQSCQDRLVSVTSSHDHFGEGPISLNDVALVCSPSLHQIVAEPGREDLAIDRGSPHYTYRG